MRVSEVFSGSKFMKAADIPQPKVFTIETVVQETIQKETKLVVQFREEQRKLVLNQTNAKAISSLYGDDCDRWTNQQVELFSTTTFFNGQQTPCIRVRRPTVSQQQPAPQFNPAQYRAAVQPPVQAPNVPFDA